MRERERIEGTIEETLRTLSNQMTKGRRERMAGAGAAVSKSAVAFPRARTSVGGR